MKPPDSVVRASDVFVPGRYPEITYNPRDALMLEQRLRDYLDERGTILTIAGPTKTGKTTLVKSVVGSKVVWVDGQGIESVDQLWRRIGDSLEVFTNYQLTKSRSSSTGAKGGAKVGIPATANLEATLDLRWDVDDAASKAVDRPIDQVVPAALKTLKHLVVIDDFHFIKSDVQKEIVRAVKPLAFAGVPICLIAITHRLEDVVRREKDMTGRLEALRVTAWSEDELKFIAARGFEAMNVKDPEGVVSSVLALNSFGSPHLMQKFCREICKYNKYSQRPFLRSTLQAPASWADFFSSQVDDASSLWFQRFLTGPAPGGTPRSIYDVKEDRRFDQYGLTLLALKQLGPQLSSNKGAIDRAVGTLVSGTGPAAHQTTRALQRMTKIAERSLETPVRSDPDYDDDLETEAPEVQPVLEYLEDGPNSTLHLVDPFFAFYLKWGSEEQFRRASDRQKLSPQEESTLLDE